jgi:hypothetical protein
VKGASEADVLWRHALPNILVPVVTIVALAFGYLLEGTVLDGRPFRLAGARLYITQSLFSADMPAVLGGTLVVGVCFVVLTRPPRSPTPSSIRGPAPDERLRSRPGDRGPILPREAWLRQFMRGVRRAARNPSTFAEAWIVLLLVFAAATAPLLATHDPMAQDLSTRLSPPGAATGSAPTSSGATSTAGSSTARDRRF